MIDGYNLDISKFKPKKKKPTINEDEMKKMIDEYNLDISKLEPKKKKKPIKILDDDDFESADEYEAPPIAPPQPFTPRTTSTTIGPPQSKIDYSKENEKWINLISKGASIPQIKNDMITKGFDISKMPDTKQRNN
jgi:hypothetical protein